MKEFRLVSDYPRQSKIFDCENTFNNFLRRSDIHIYDIQFQAAATKHMVHTRILVIYCKL